MLIREIDTTCSGSYCYIGMLMPMLAASESQHQQWDATGWPLVTMQTMQCFSYQSLRHAEQCDADNHQTHLNIHQAETVLRDFNKNWPSDCYAHEQSLLVKEGRCICPWTALLIIVHLPVDRCLQEWVLILVPVVVARPAPLLSLTLFTRTQNWWCSCSRVMLSRQCMYWPCQWGYLFGKLVIYIPARQEVPGLNQPAGAVTTVIMAPEMGPPEGSNVYVGGILVAWGQHRLYRRCIVVIYESREVEKGSLMKA